MRVGNLRFVISVVFISFFAYGIAQGVAIDPKKTSASQQQPYEVITEFQSIVDVIESTEKEVLLRVDTLRNQEIAEALRRAIVERDVTVYMMIPTDGLEDNGSYFLALASIGAKTRIADGQGAFLVSDRKVTVFGNMLENRIVTQGDMVTMKVASENYALAAVNGFITAYSKLGAWDWKSILEGDTAEVNGEGGSQ